MSEAQEEITRLRRRLEEAEKNTIMAATYGKQLLDENHELHSKLEENVKEYSLKIEALEQSKHAITLKYETKLQNEQSLIQELEQMKEQQARQIERQVTQETQSFEKEIQKMQRMVSSAEAALERVQSDNQQHIERSSLLEAQIKEAQERIDMYNTSIHDLSTDEAAATMQSQIMTLTCEKQDLEMQVSLLNAELKSCKLKLSQAQTSIETLTKELEELECQSTSYFNALEKSREEMIELKMEIDMLKLAETDPGKKGNSLFAEVEDNRQVMEQHLQEYKSRYNIVKKQCDIKTQQINKMKIQLANLLCLSSNKADVEYLSHLEESLASARRQLDAVKKQCQTSEGKQANTVVEQVQPTNDVKGSEDGNMSKFFKTMYLESQKKAEELEQAMKTEQFDKVVLSDRILQLQRKLRQAEASRDSTCSKLINLQVKFDEISSKKVESVGNGTKNQKQVTEKIPGFSTVPDEKLEEEEEKEEKIEIENRIPLKEKQVNVDLSNVVNLSKDEPRFMKGDVIMKEDAPPSKVMAKETDQENRSVMPSYEHKKKAKKSVRMIETVVVQDGDGEVQEAELKTEGTKKNVPETRKKVLRKMTAPVVKVPSSGQQNECNQQ